MVFTDQKMFMNRIDNFLTVLEFPLAVEHQIFSQGLCRESFGLNDQIQGIEHEQ